MPSKGQTLEPGNKSYVSGCIRGKLSSGFRGPSPEGTGKRLRLSEGTCHLGKSEIISRQSRFWKEGGISWEPTALSKYRKDRTKHQGRMFNYIDA